MMQYQIHKGSLLVDLESFRIPLVEINLATRNFSPKSQLQHDEQCNVYKGTLPERWHRLAAIKSQRWRGSEALNEFLLLSKCTHENIIPFIGYCDEDDKKIIVTDYAINGSLDCHLQDAYKRRDLTWAKRLEICLGAAKGLKYLQSCLGDDTIVIYRNFQSKYILLDENMEAKICCISFSRLVSTKQPQADSSIVSSNSNNYYMDPVYQESCILRAESVVYSFGVVLFELISGMLSNAERSIGDFKPHGLIKLVRRNYDVGLESLIDVHIRGEIDRRSFYSIKEMAYKCISLNIEDRPSMDMIIKTIKEALDTHNHGADSIITIRSHQHQNAKDFKIPLSDLKLATKNFTWPIYSGSTEFGSIYAGRLSGSFQNRKAAIKRYDQEGEHQDEFLNELDMMYSLQHENIIPFIGYCEEGNEMIIVSEYATNDSLYHLMVNKKICLITWAQRLEICLGAARGLKYLHSGLGDRGRVIHRTFSSRKILLDDNMKARICGFVYSVLVPRYSQQVYQPMGAWPYKDPVYHASDILTTEVDMYSFGMVMFELLIGELFFPPNWLKKRLPYTLMNIVRNKYHTEPYSLVDHAIRDQVDSQSLLTYIEVASKCISFNLKDRPSMNRIVNTIEKLLNFQDNGSVSTITIRGPKFEKIEDFKIPLDVMKVSTEDFSTSTKIGDGGFGIIYKAKLTERWQNRTAAIKRLNPGDQQARNDEFHMELHLIFTFSHENIIPFIGYCDEENEKIIATEYAVNGSLDFHLEDPEKRRLLTWEQRLKICLGAAKGLKHLHSGQGEYNKVIHRDVKSANILLDENMVAKLCDFGLSRSGLTDLQATDSSGLFTCLGGTDVYIDPIYRESGKLRTASDVYSFGVVLFEMLSGKLAYAPIKSEDGKLQLLINVVRRYKAGILDKLMDPYIKDGTDDRSFFAFQDIAYECISLNYKKRPTMDKIIDRIEDALDYQESKSFNTSYTRPVG